MTPVAIEIRALRVKKKFSDTLLASFCTVENAYGIPCQNPELSNNYVLYLTTRRSWFKGVGISNNGGAKTKLQPICNVQNRMPRIERFSSEPCRRKNSSQPNDKEKLARKLTRQNMEITGLWKMNETSLGGREIDSTLLSGLEQSQISVSSTVPVLRGPTHLELKSVGPSMQINCIPVH